VPILHLSTYSNPIVAHVFFPYPYLTIDPVIYHWKKEVSNQEECPQKTHIPYRKLCKGLRKTWRKTWHRFFEDCPTWAIDLATFISVRPARTAWDNACTGLVVQKLIFQTPDSYSDNLSVWTLHTHEFESSKVSKINLQPLHEEASLQTLRWIK